MSNLLEAIQQEINAAGGNIHVAAITQLCDKPGCYFCEQMYRNDIIKEVNYGSWKPYEIKFIKDNWSRLPLRIMSFRLKKSQLAIRKRGTLLNLGKKPHYYGRT